MVESLDPRSAISEFSSAGGAWQLQPLGPRTRILLAAFGRPQSLPLGCARVRSLLIQDTASM